MSTLLIIHHTTSPTLDDMLEAVVRGASRAEVQEVDVATSPALTTTPVHLLGADAVILGTPANMGYMAGAMKVFFDNVYYPCLRETTSLPYGLYVHGNDDVTGAVRSVQQLASGLRWRAVAPAVEVLGAATKEDFERLSELGTVAAASVM